MISPLKKARLSREQTLQFVANAVGIDTGDLTDVGQHIHRTVEDLLTLTH